MNWICKLLCVILGIGIAALLGYSESARLKLRVHTLERLLRFFQQMEEEIRYTACPIHVLLEQHQEEIPFLSDCKTEMEQGASFWDSWRSAISWWQSESGLTQEDVRYLLEFGAAFGGLDKEGQLSGVQLTIRRLDQQREAAEENSRTKGKLFRSLGVLCGAGIALLVV